MLLRFYDQIYYVRNNLWSSLFWSSEYNFFVLACFVQNAVFVAARSKD